MWPLYVSSKRFIIVLCYMAKGQFNRGIFSSDVVKTYVNTGWRSNDWYCIMLTSHQSLLMGFYWIFLIESRILLSIFINRLFFFDGNESYNMILPDMKSFDVCACLKAMFCCTCRCVCGSCFVCKCEPSVHLYSRMIAVWTWLFFFYRNLLFWMLSS